MAYQPLEILPENYETILARNVSAMELEVYCSVIYDQFGIRLNWSEK